MAKRGRPKQEVKRNRKLVLRLTPEEKDILDRRAKELGITKTKYIRQMVFGED